MKYLHLIIQKSSKAGEESEWAKARVAQYNMLLDRLEGKINLSPIHLHALVLWDEKHKKQILGPMSKYQYRVYRKDGKPTHKEDNAELRSSMPRRLEEVLEWRLGKKMMGAMME